MRTRSEVTAEKLRGGFYSPDALVDHCWDRIASLTRDRSCLRVLEPSAGDGAFIRGIGRNPRLLDRIGSVTAIEPMTSEAEKCSIELQRQGLLGRVETRSAIEWAVVADDLFDVAVGNPPFVRFQFLSDADKLSIKRLQERLQISLAGVSNLWLPLLIGSLERLRPGGAFAFIVPAECFTGISAGALRAWLVERGNRLRFDMFPPGSFPLVLQEIVIVSGQRSSRANSATLRCEFCDHPLRGRVTTTVHLIPPSAATWTRFLLTKAQIDAHEEATHLPKVQPLGRVAKFEVAAVTGANDYFSVDDSTLKEYQLEAWSTPLLPRIRHALGLRYTETDHEKIGDAGTKAHLLDFSAERPDPCQVDGPLRYLTIGVVEGLPDRYKCSIRKPWYRIPFIRPGQIMLSKRCHQYPRAVLNEAGVVTTDTIYRGSMVNTFVGRESDVVAAFHNSLTLLAAELEGRTFGGGVLELVPSEVSRLSIPLPERFGDELDRLDSLTRGFRVGDSEGDVLIEETDLLLAKADLGLSPGLLDTLGTARDSLVRRRMDRNAAL